MRVFISYSHSDKKFVLKLASDLKTRGIIPWFDEWEMTPGDSLSCRIEEGIEDASLFLVVLSSRSLKSGWCKKELSAAWAIEVKKNDKFIIPVLYEQCKLPPFLNAKKYADFINNYEDGLEDLLRAIPLITYTEIEVPCPYCNVISKHRIRNATVASTENKPIDCSNCMERYFLHVRKGATGFYTTKSDNKGYGVHPTKGLDLISAVTWTLKKKQVWVDPNQLDGITKLMEEAEEELELEKKDLTVKLLLNTMLKSDKIALHGVSRQFVRYFITVLYSSRYFLDSSKKPLNRTKTLQKFKSPYFIRFNKRRVIEHYIKDCIFKLHKSGVVKSTENVIKVCQFLLGKAEEDVDVVKLGSLVSEYVFKRS